MFGRLNALNVVRVLLLVAVMFPAVPVVFWLNVGQVNVPLLKLPDVGAPRMGVTSEGDVDKTTEPVPVDVVTPVPPLSTGNAVPEYESANVPEVVTGLPDTERNVGADNATELTVPVGRVCQVVA